MHRWYTRDWMDYAAVKDNYTLPPNAMPRRFDRPDSLQHTSHGCARRTLKPPYSAS